MYDAKRLFASEKGHFQQLISMWVYYVLIPNVGSNNEQYEVDMKTSCHCTIRLIWVLGGGGEGGEEGGRPNFKFPYPCLLYHLFRV